MRATFAAGIGALVLAVIASAQSTRWLDATSGDWHDPTRWDNGVPTPGSDVVIDAVGSAYTATLQSPASIHDLLLDSGDALLFIDRSELNLGGTATLADGVLRFRSVVLHGGTLITESSGDLILSGYDSVLDGVRVQGDLDLDTFAAAVRVRNGTTVTGTVNLAGTVRFGFDGDQTFAGRILHTGSSGGRVMLEGDPVTVTVGATATVRGRNLQIGGAGATSSAAERTLINEGRIIGDVPFASGIQFRDLHALRNDGTFEAVDGARMSVQNSVETFTNYGQILVGPDARVEVAASAWENPGQVQVTSGSLSIRGTIDPAVIGLTAGRIRGDADSTLELRDIIDNAGQTLRTDDFGGRMLFHGGRISGGTLQTTDPGDYDFSSGSNALQDVTVLGDLDLDSDSARLELAGNTTVSGTINLTGERAELRLFEEQTYSASILQSGPERGSVALSAGASTATLGPDTLIRGRRLEIGSTYFLSEQVLINQGTVRAEDDGRIEIEQLAELTNEGFLQAVEAGRLLIANTVGTFTNRGRIEIDSGGLVSVSSATWDNPGTINVYDGALAIGGDFPTAAMGLGNGRITGNAGTTLNLAGTIDNTGETIRTSDFGGLLQLGCVRIVGGTLVTTDAADYDIADCFSNTLDGVIVKGDLDLDTPYAEIRLRNGTSISGAIKLSDRDAQLRIEGDQSLPGAILQSGIGSGYLTLEGNGATLTLAETATMAAHSLVVDSANDIDQTLINNGVVQTTSLGHVYFLDLASLINRGLFEAIDEGQVLVNTVSFVNDGQWRIGADSRGTIQTDGWRNPGSFTVTGGTLELSGDFKTADTGLREGRIVGDATSVLAISATMDNTDQVFHTGDFGGTVELDEGQIVGGVLYPGDNFDASRSQDNALDGVDVRGDLVLDTWDATLSLRNGTTVSGTVRLSAPNARLGLEGEINLAGPIVQTGPICRLGPVGEQATVTLEVAAMITGESLDIGRVFGGDGDYQLINHGTVRGQASSSFGVRLLGIDVLTNHGTFEAVRGGRIYRHSTGTNLTNLVDGVLTGGRYRVEDDSELDLDAPITTNNAEIEMRGPTAAFLGLEALDTNLGSLTLGRGAQLNLTGGLELGADGVLRIEVTGRGNAAIVPRIDAAGPAHLGGTLILDVSELSPRCLTPDHTFTFLDATSYSGSFAVVEIIGMDPADVTLDGQGGFRLDPTPCPADANVDGIVDGLDILVVLTDFGRGGLSLPGDLNCDESVDISDLATALAEYDTRCP